MNQKKRLGYYQQEQFNLPREYSVFDSSQCIINNGKLQPLSQVLSPTRLSRSIGTGRREPWERGGEVTDAAAATRKPNKQ